MRLFQQIIFYLTVENPRETNLINIHRNEYNLEKLKPTMKSVIFFSTQKCHLEKTTILETFLKKITIRRYAVYFFSR